MFGWSALMSDFSEDSPMTPEGGQIFLRRQIFSRSRPLLSIEGRPSEQDLEKLERSPIKLYHIHRHQSSLRIRRA